MAGGRIDDGFKTLVGFAGQPLLKIWIKTVKPPGITGGGKIATTNMTSNIRLRTFAPKKLYEITDGELKAAYDPAVLVQILDRLQKYDTITVTFADNSTQVFQGWLEEFVPDDITEGEQPTAAIKFVCSGQTSGLVETAPIYGTGS